MIKKHLDEITTQTTLPRTRKLLIRQPNTSSKSREKSRKQPKSETFSSSITIPYIRMNLLHLQQSVSENKLKSMEKSLQNIEKHNKIGQSTYRKIQRDPFNSKNKLLQKKIEDLLEETIMRQQQLNQFAVQKSNLLMEIQSLKTQIKILNQGNGVLLKSEFNLKEALRKATKEKNILQNQKLGLLKKISELQKKFFSDKNCSLTSLRQQHLEKEVHELKQLAARARSDKETVLQNQVKELTIKLFDANKLVQSLRIHNVCLQQKSQSISKQMKKTPELMGLKSKYDKIFEQRNELKCELKRWKEVLQKEIQELSKQNKKLLKQIQRLKQLPFGEESLNLSMVSGVSQI